MLTTNSIHGLTFCDNIFSDTNVSFRGELTFDYLIIASFRFVYVSYFSYLSFSTNFLLVIFLLFCYFTCIVDSLYCSCWSSSKFLLFVSLSAFSIYLFTSTSLILSSYSLGIIALIFCILYLLFSYRYFFFFYFHTILLLF
jgi:hypothetical protein